MRLAKSTLGLRDGYGDRDREQLRRNELLPRLQTGQDSMVMAHQAYLMTSSPCENTKPELMLGTGASPIFDEPRPPELGRRRILSRKLSIKSFRQWIQNQRRPPSPSIMVDSTKMFETRLINKSHQSDSIMRVTPTPAGKGSVCSPIGQMRPNSDCSVGQVARMSSVIIKRKKSDSLSPDVISSQSSLSPASSGTSATSDEIRTPAAHHSELFATSHRYQWPRPSLSPSPSPSDQQRHEIISMSPSSSPSPPPPYRSPVPVVVVSPRRIPTKHPSLPSIPFGQQRLHRSPSSLSQLHFNQINPPSHLLNLPACSIRFGIPCVIDMASNSPPLRQPILSSSSPLTSAVTPLVHDTVSNSPSTVQVPLPSRDDLSIAYTGPGVGNKVTKLDQRLPQLSNLNLGPVINKIIQPSTPVSPAPSISFSDPQQPSCAPLNALIASNLLSPERPLSIVEEDPPPDQVEPLAQNLPPASGLPVAPMFEPDSSSNSFTNPSLSTIHPYQTQAPDNISSSPTRSPATLLPECTSPTPDRLSASGSSSRFVKSAPTTKVDVSHKHGETHPFKLPALAEKKSVFGKLFDRRNEAKSAIGGSTSTEGSGNESETNVLGVGNGVTRYVQRKPSTKTGGHASDACSNPGSTALNEPEGISGPRLMALQGSVVPHHTGGKPKSGSERGGEDKPSGGSSKLRDMVGGKLGRKPSSSKGGRSEDGKSDDGENRSRAGSQATTSLLKKYGVCEKAAIGKGATAVVRLAHKWDRGTDKLYAVKEFRKRRKNESEKEYVKKLTSEFCISSTLHHENIVETVDLVQDENQHWCEVMEYCPGGDLYAAIKRGSMKQQEINSYFKQLLSGIAYLHQMGVAHRDIKPENLLLDGKGRIKITDFGVSDVFRMCWEKTAHLSKGLCGSEPYLPKEIFERKEYDARLIDVWSCGIVYYCCCIQELPWRVAKKTDSSYMNFVESYESSLTPTPLINLTKDSRKVIKKMLHPEPEGRVQIDEVLQDEWINSLQVLAV